MQQQDAILEWNAVPTSATNSSGDPMTEARKRAILFAATLLCARKLIETIESDKPNLPSSILWIRQFGRQSLYWSGSIVSGQRAYNLEGRVLGARCPISTAGSNGRCNTFQCLDSTMLPRDKRSVWLYSIKT